MQLVRKNEVKKCVMSNSSLKRRYMVNWESEWLAANCEMMGHAHEKKLFWQESNLVMLTAVCIDLTFGKII